MPNNDLLIAQAAAGVRVTEFLSDPEVQAIFNDAVGGLEKTILGFDPRQQMDTTIAKSMLLGIRELWDKFSGVVLVGRQAEAVLSGEQAEIQPGRVL